MLFQHWSKVPTIRDMVAGYLGIGGPDQASSAPRLPQSEAEVMRAILMHGTGH
jgi:hypothetical protein